MSNPLSIRLAQSEASNVYQNGHYEYDIGDEIILENGDMLIAQSMYIDTQQLSSGTFVFAEDTILSISGILYEVNDDLDGKQIESGTLTDPDYETYQMQVTLDKTDPTKEKLYYVVKQSITVPSGSYEPQALSQYITNELSYVEPLTGQEFIQSGSNLLLNTLASLSEDIQGLDLYNPANGVDGGQELTNPDFFGPGPGSVFPKYYGQAVQGEGPGYAVAMFWSNDTQGVIPMNPPGPGVLPKSFIEPVSTSGNGTGLKIEILFFGLQYVFWTDNKPQEFGYPEYPYVNVVDPGTGYQLGDSITFTSDQFHWWNDSGNPELGGNAIPGYPQSSWINCQKGGTVTFAIDKVADGDSYFEFTRVGQPPSTSTPTYRYTEQYWIGASEVDIEFNTSFSWKFLHTPVYDSDVTPPQPAVRILQDSNNLWRTIDRTSGIALTALTPPEIWTRMGFNLDEILCKAVDPDDGRLVSINRNTPSSYPIDLDSFSKSTTRSYLGLNALVTNSSSAGTRKVPTAAITEATTLTTPINGADYVVDTGAGHFIVQVNAGYNQGIEMDNGHLQAAAIVSKQFNSNDIVTGGIDSGIAYIHSGAPISLSRFEVKILDGKSMLLDSSLGNDNTIYLQIQKAAPVPEQLPQKTEKEMDTV